MLYIQIIVSLLLAIAIIILFKLKQIKMTNEEILQKLIEADEATNDIAADIQKLIEAGGISPEAQAALQAHVDKLKGIAAER